MDKRKNRHDIQEEDQMTDKRKTRYDRQKEQQT